MNKIITKMIEEYIEDKDFLGNVSEEKIKKAENTLGVKFPKEYREFVQSYGSGGICGVDLLGIEGDLGASVVNTTERYRTLGLEKNIIVIQDLDEYIMCMNTSDDNGIIYSWNRTEKKLNKRYESFTEFLMDAFQEGIDNL